MPKGALPFEFRLRIDVAGGQAIAASFICNLSHIGDCQSDIACAVRTPLSLLILQGSANHS